MNTKTVTMPSSLVECDFFAVPVLFGYNIYHSRNYQNSKGECIKVGEIREKIISFFEEDLSEISNAENRNLITLAENLCK